MNFFVTDTFRDSPAKLTGNEKKAAKNTVFELHVNTAQPGLRKHRLDYYNGGSFFVRHTYFFNARDPYKALKTTLKAEINREALETLRSDTSRPFDKPTSERIAVTVINHLGDEVMQVFRV